MKELPKRKPNRLKNYDYSQNGAYFVTICVKNRLKLFGTVVVGATAQLSEIGNCETIVWAISNRSNPNNRPHPDANRPYMLLSEYGEIVETAIQHNNRDEFWIEQYVIMPDHVHMIIVISNDGGHGDRTEFVPTVSSIVRYIKSYVTKQIGFSPWQKSFHDHIIRSQDDYNRIAEYIQNNPAHWHDDQQYEHYRDKLLTFKNNKNISSIPPENNKEIP